MRDVSLPPYKIPNLPALGLKITATGKATSFGWYGIGKCNSSGILSPLVVEGRVMSAFHWGNAHDVIIDTLVEVIVLERGHRKVDHVSTSGEHIICTYI